MGLDFSDMNWFDIAVISVIFMSTILAFFRGFIKAFLSLVAWICAGSAAAYFFPMVKDALSGSIENPKVLIAVSSIGVFLVVFIILAIINAKILFSLREFRKGVIDRSMGFAFGLARGALIVCAVFWSINVTSKMLNYGDKDKPGPTFFTEAKTYNILQMTTDAILSALPEQFPSLMVDKIDKFKDKAISSISSDGDSGDGLPRTLNDDEKKVMAKVIAALPKQDYSDIRQRYQGKVGSLSDLDKMAIFRDILEAYDVALKDNKIESDKKVSDDDIKMLTHVLNGKQINKNELPADEGTGYKDLNIKQMDRLIDSVE